MDADGGWSSELAYAALAVITTEPIGALVRVLSLLCRPVYDCSFIMPVSFPPRVLRFISAILCGVVLV